MMRKMRMTSLAALTIEPCQSHDTARRYPATTTAPETLNITHVHYSAEDVDSLYQSIAGYRHKTFAWAQEYAFSTGTQARRKVFTEKYREKDGHLHVS
jgi:hypothetical protein